MNKFKETFAAISASELKAKTLLNLSQKPVPKSYLQMTMALACLVVIFFGSYMIFLLPTSFISIDINPSLELAINRFDRVVSVKAYNDDAEELLKDYNFFYADYQTVVDSLMTDETIITLLESDNFMEVAVVGEENNQTERLYNYVDNCLKDHENSHCLKTDDLKGVQSAHHHNMSYGKYQAYEHLNEYGEDISIEEINDMNMAEIKELLNKCHDNEGHGHHH